MFDIKNNKYKYVSGLLFGILVGVIFYLIQPVKYKAHALIKIGQCAQNYCNNIESANLIIERVKLPAFIRSVAARAKTDDILWVLNENEGSGLTFKQLKTGDALLITIVSETPNLAKITAESIVEELIQTNVQIADLYLSNKRKEILILDHEIDAISRISDKLLISIANLKFEKVQDLLLFNLIAMQNTLEYKRNRSLSLQDSVLNFSEGGIRLLEPIVETKHLIFQTLWRPCILGGLLGLVLSFVWIRLKKAAQ